MEQTYTTFAVLDTNTDAVYQTTDRTGAVVTLGIEMAAHRYRLIAIDYMDARITQRYFGKSGPLSDYLFSLGISDDWHNSQWRKVA